MTFSPPALHIFSSAKALLFLLLFGSSDHSTSTQITLWVLRIVTFSLIARTYLGPWILSQLSDHIRIRSISLWSIRGIYIRTGRRTWRIERISYVWSSIDGQRRFLVKIDGGSLHIGKQEKKHVKVVAKHRRNLTLSDFNPSPLAQYAWSLVSASTALIEPYIRPVIRTYFIACLRVGIKWLPKLTQALTFDLHSMVITFEEVSGAKIIIEEINLHTMLELKHLEHNPEVSHLKQPTNNLNNRVGHGMTAWKKRLAESFQRSLDNALGDSRGSATISLKICNIMGTMPRESSSDSLKIPFLLSPGAINIGLNVKFNPKEGAVEPLGLRLSLTVGDCSAKLDLFKVLVDKVFPSRPSQNSQQPVSPPAYAKNSFFPLMDIGGQLSLVSPSPIQSSRTSLFSPVSLFSSSTITSNQPPFSPNSTDLNLTSPRSPSSPFLQAISASMRSHRRHLIQPSEKLKDHKDKSRISILNSIYICISSITLSAFSEAEVGPYRAQIKDIKATLVRSDPSQSSLHMEQLGSGKNEEDLNAYALGLAFHHVSLERDSDHGLMRLGRITSIEVESLIYQWPAPFLNPSPFLSNDPNAPLFALRIRLSDIHMTDKISDIQRLLGILQHASTTDNDQLQENGCLSTLTAPLAFPIPRIHLAIECGPMIAGIIYDIDKGERHRAVELRSNAFSVTMNARYNHPANSVSRYFPAASSVQALHWTSILSGNVEPILVRVRLKHEFNGYDASKLLTSDKDFLDDPPIFSIGGVDISGSANAIARMDSTHNSFAIIDSSTILADLTASFETISVELWHPISVEAILRMMSLLPPPLERQMLRSTTLPRIYFPTGLTTKLTVERFSIIITAPDINPRDTLELARGFALRTGITCEYSSLRGHQEHWFNNLQRSQNRTRLSLPVEPLTDAIVASKVFGPPGDKSAFLKIRFSNFVFRTAVATQYESDEPIFLDHRDHVNSAKEIVRVDTFQADICMSSKQAAENAHYVDTCDISLQVPLVRLYFKLIHAYSILLGLQTVIILCPPRSSHRHTTSNQPIQSPVILCHGNVTAVQAVVALPTQKLVIRIDGLSGRTASSGSPRMKWIKATVFVRLPLRTNRWESPSRNKWDELITLQSWEISYSVLAGTPCVSVDGDGGRVRIPHGFVLSDLIQDVNITLKATKHLAHMASTGCYTDMPSPKPEDPKQVPHLTIRLGSLCLEAEDDPFESRLGLIWSTAPDAAWHRNEREEAFKAKVTAILHAERDVPQDNERVPTDAEYQFGATHTVSIEEARRRLDDVHALDWTLRLRQAKEKRERTENFILHKLFGTFVSTTSDTLLDFMNLAPPSSDPPLLRLMLENLCLTISPPSFTLVQLPDVLHSLGGGLPRDTQFSLTIPLHIHFTLSSMTASIRNYPLPMLHIPERTDPSQIAWTFDTDLVIAEEMGTNLSVDWIPCPVIGDRESVYGESAFSILVPKTIMPVKTYAAPVIRITADEPTIFSWGVSYGPAIQDVMRVIDTLSSPPRDPSPHLGFWDKIRLVFHWTAKVTFSQDIHLYIKGTRDPSEVLDSGSGFVFCWQGNPELRVGYENPQKELVQVTSESMLIAVPDLDDYDPKSRPLSEQGFSHSSKPFRKICARLSSGVRYGIGFTLERSCGPECIFCTGTPFDRKCRFFSFRPHYDVKLELKADMPVSKDENDSYKRFRSDFVHLSFSLASSTRTEEYWAKPKNNKATVEPSNLHLTPKVFAHFWSWCSLFDGVLTLPIRQGNYYTPRPISPKLGRHLATLKYRISLPNLYFMHGYMDNARETWVDGVTPWVGLKGKVDELQVDMHQREEESKVPGLLPGSSRTIHRKPFYTAEVIMKGLELRAMLAIFSESMKQNVEMAAPRERSNYRKHADLPITSSTSIWYDLEDFIELDWSPEDGPTLHLLPLAMCPHFTYFKLKEALSGHQQVSKFGSEHSHICLLGKEPSIPRTQISLASARVDELKALLVPHKETQTEVSLDNKAVAKMIALLEDYISVLKEAEINPEVSSQRNARHNYYMPYDIGSSDDWANFNNVYQIHCPSIFMDSAVRDIMIQYYYRSRDVRGLEYHMAARAVKFIRDQANAALSGHDIESTGDNVKDKGQQNAAQIAASALRKVLRGDNSTKLPIDVIQEIRSDESDKIDPMSGWSDGVSLQRSHCCILLKPQIILSTETPEDKCIVAAAQAKLESFAVMDTSNVDDPVSGKIMSRNYTSLSGLQAFAPTTVNSTKAGPVPLEVLVDLRCESDAFERLVPQTEAIFHYDKFNRLRLRNKITSITTRPAVTQNIASVRDSHLQDQTDLIRVHIPRFTVSANAEHFQAISNIVTKLLLFSDPVHKSRLDKLETLIFKYDFTDLNSAASVIASLQCRARDALQTVRVTKRNWLRLEEEGEGNRLAVLHLQAHVLLLSEELNLLFDSLKMAQDRFDDHADQKSALLLHASSSEISWRMLDYRRNLLSKLVVTNINFRWLSRQDSSTVNHLTIGDLSAFDGSRSALWTEILSKYDDPPNHPLLKRGLFLLANWTILAPVGGITIYEAFELSLHPLRLQIDAKVGRKIMEYVWPGRAQRKVIEGPPSTHHNTLPQIVVKSPPATGRSSFDSPHGLQTPRVGDKQGLRRLGSSRSFTDLKTARETHTSSSSNPYTPQGFLSPTGFMKRTHSSDSINMFNGVDASNDQVVNAELIASNDGQHDASDAQVMKKRSSQKTFILVKISSIHVLLSVVKEGSFECHEARITTRELEYRNQTSSFEELVNQFIPSSMSWRGWVKMALHQPLVPVLPVARELLAKTKWTAASKLQLHDSSIKSGYHHRISAADDVDSSHWTQNESSRRTESSSKSIRKYTWRNNKDVPHVTSLPLTEEPESLDGDTEQLNLNIEHSSRKRVKSLFSNMGQRSSSKSRGRDKRKSEDAQQSNT